MTSPATQTRPLSHKRLHHPRGNFCLRSLNPKSDLYLRWPLWQLLFWWIMYTNSFSVYNLKLRTEQNLTQIQIPRCWNIRNEFHYLLISQGRNQGAGKEVDWLTEIDLQNKLQWEPSNPQFALHRDQKLAIFAIPAYFQNELPL